MASAVTIDRSTQPQVSALVRAFDWASTPLGPIEQWPASLRLAYNLCEAARAVTAVYWGPEFHLIYNQAWADVLPERHPRALGSPAREAWSDSWHILRPDFERVLEQGRAGAIEEQLLPLHRNGRIEETYWNYGLTPVRDENGAVRGVFVQASEVTKTVRAQKRLAFQIALADRLRGLLRPEEVKIAAVEMLGQHLDVARAGYGQINEAQERVTVHRDWTRDASIASLAGESRILEAFGADVIAILRTGDTLVVNDYRTDPRVSAENAATWESIGTRALIVVPLVKAGVLKALLYLHEPEPRAWRREEAELARDVAERTWAAVERAQAERELRDSEDHYRHTVELNPQVSWTSLPDGQLNRVSQRWHDWTGTTGLGETWANGLHPDDRERTFEVWGRSVASGEPYDIEHRVQHLSGEYRWARSQAFPRYGEDGSICLWYGVTEDTHERKRAEERQRLLINELNHRVKNTLATVQAIAFQTLKSDISLSEARARFEARLLALSRAHNLLTDQNWEGASLERVVADAIDYLPHERFEIAGEPVWLAPRAALALALALHELSTNAVKYGGLCGEGGKVRVGWSLDGDRLAFQWKELGGPPVTKPNGRGFGSRLIERGLAADLGGTARFLFEPDGLRCRIEASLKAVQAHEAEGG